SIGKRVEDGSKNIVSAIAACPVTIDILLASVREVRAGTLPLDQIIVGLVDAYDEAEPDDDIGPTTSGNDLDEEKIDDRNDELYAKSLAKFEVIEAWHRKMRDAFETQGPHSQVYMEAREAVQSE